MNVGCHTFTSLVHYIHECISEQPHSHKLKTLPKQTRMHFRSSNCTFIQSICDKQENWTKIVLVFNLIWDVDHYGNGGVSDFSTVMTGIMKQTATMSLLVIFQCNVPRNCSERENRINKKIVGTFSYDANLHLELICQFSK